MVIISTII